MKRERYYLLMSMESRDIYIRRSVSNTHARIDIMSVYNTDVSMSYL